MGMLQFSLGLVVGTLMGVFIMCLLIMAGRSPEPPADQGADRAKLLGPVGQPQVKFQD